MSQKIPIKLQYRVPSLKIIVPLTLWLPCFLFIKSANSISFDADDKSEVELQLNIQGNHRIHDNCNSEICPQRNSLSEANSEFVFKHYPNTNSLIFAGIGLNLTNERSAFPEIPQNNEMENGQFEQDNDDTEYWAVGFSHFASEFSLGKLVSETNGFGSSTYNMMNFSMHGLNDDRIDLFRSEPGVTVETSSMVEFDSGFSLSGSLASDLENPNGSKISINYDTILEFTSPDLKGVQISFAAKSISGTKPNFEIEATGFKLSNFLSNGLEFSASYSHNDFGYYREFSISKTIGYRHKIGLGISNFRTSSSPPDIPNRLTISDSDYYYLNYDYAYSRFLHGFIERDHIDYGYNTEKATLIGFRLSF